MPISQSFAKVLSENDLGLTGGHQAGPLIPKQHIVYFPALNERLLNPREPIRLRRNGTLFKDAQFIHYNNRKFGGTRDEYRITPLSAREYAALGARAGDFLVFYRMNEHEYEIEMVSAGSEKSVDLQLPARPRMGSSLSVPTETIHDFNEAMERIAAGDFSVPDTWARAKQRRFQWVFRSLVLENFGVECCMPRCRVDDARFLDASHIKQWQADITARLDPANGLLLCKNHHVAFDEGLVSLEKRGSEFRVLVARRLGTSGFLSREIGAFRGVAIRRPRHFDLGENYINHHRNHVFLG